jgi:CBS domain-containing protein
LFAHHGISGVPVVRKDDGQVVGLVTSKDLFRKSHESQLALIMRKNPITVSPTTDLDKAVRLMVENRIHRLIVISKGKLVGIVTPHDVFPAIIEKNLPDPVISYATRRCVPIYQETPLFIAWRILKISYSYALPVLDKKGQLAGIITDRDFFGLGKIGSVMKSTESGIGEDEDLWTWESLKNIMKVYYEVSDIDLPTDPVSTVMNKNPVTVFAMTSVSNAAKKMYQNNFRILPIVDTNDNLINAISDLEVLASILPMEERIEAARKAKELEAPTPGERKLLREEAIEFIKAKPDFAKKLAEMEARRKPAPKVARQVPPKVRPKSGKVKGIMKSRAPAKKKPAKKKPAKKKPAKKKPKKKPAKKKPKKKPAKKKPKKKPAKKKPKKKPAKKKPKKKPAKKKPKKKPAKKKPKKKKSRRR